MRKSTKTASWDIPTKYGTQQKKHPLMPFEINGTLQKWHMLNTPPEIYKYGTHKTSSHTKMKSFAKNLQRLFAMNWLSDFWPYLGWALSGLLTDGGPKRPLPPLPKICHTYPSMVKLGTVIPYLKKIQKIYKSCDTPPEFYWHQYFFNGNQQILLYQEIQI